jgi:hypothetical protein
MLFGANLPFPLQLGFFYNHYMPVHAALGALQHCSWARHGLTPTGSQRRALSSVSPVAIPSALFPVPPSVQLNPDRSFATNPDSLFVLYTLIICAGKI